MSDKIAREVRITRRAVIASLVWLAAGCASPSGARPRLQGTRTTFLEPGYDPELKMRASEWQSESAATLKQVRGQLNANAGPWSKVVVSGFSDAFISALQSGGVGVDRMAGSAISAEKSLSYPLVRSFLTAGFVSKTWISPSYAPFVSVVLQLWGPNGAMYRQLYVATDRPFNIFMTTLPPVTSFLLADVASLKNNPAPALDALRSLAQQLAQKFASDLLT